MSVVQAVSRPGEFHFPPPSPPKPIDVAVVDNEGNGLDGYVVYKVGEPPIGFSLKMVALEPYNAQISLSSETGTVTAFLYPRRAGIIIQRDDGVDVTNDFIAVGKRNAGFSPRCHA